jgi:hypothetical protein
VVAKRSCMEDFEEDVIYRLYITMAVVVVVGGGVVLRQSDDVFRNVRFGVVTNVLSPPFRLWHPYGCNHRGLLRIHIATAIRCCEDVDVDMIMDVYIYIYISALGMKQKYRPHKTI